MDIVNNISTTQATSSTSHSVSADRQKDEYVPKTLIRKRGDNLRSCDQHDYVKGECCSQSYIVGRVIDKAYAHGLQSHAGIKEIQNYPCVPNAELDRLANDIHQKAKMYGIPMELPEGMNLENDISSLSYNSGKIRRYCKEVLFEKLAHQLGRIKESKPVAFTADVFSYCTRNAW